MPDESARRQIWQAILSKRAGFFALFDQRIIDDDSKLSETKFVDVNKLAQATSGMSPADIHGVVGWMLRRMMQEERATGIQPPSYEQPDILKALERFLRTRPTDI